MVASVEEALNAYVHAKTAKNREHRIRWWRKFLRLLDAMTDDAFCQYEVEIAKLKQERNWR